MNFKRNRTRHEKILDCLDTKVKNLHPTLRQTLIEELQLNPIADSVVKCKAFISKKLSLPESGPKTRIYWLSRGWSNSEAHFKMKEFMGSRKKTKSPFSKEFWMEKIDLTTGILYTETDAQFQANSRRPIRKEYWLVRGYSEEESERLAIETKQNNNQRGAVASSLIDKQVRKSTSKRCVDYWLLRGHSEEEAKQLVSSQQQTFSLAKCIEKHGEKEGRETWQARQLKWQKTLIDKPSEERERINRLKVGNGYSISTAERVILKQLQEVVEVEHQFPLSCQTGKQYVYDFKYANKIIEYNGDWWHCHPSKYMETYYHPRVKKIARDIWLKDEQKIRFANDNGFDVIVIWEHDYKANPEKVIEQCLKFLTQ